MGDGKVNVFSPAHCTCPEVEDPQIGTSIMTRWYYCEIMPCLIRSPWAPWHRSRRPVQWPAAARMESGQCQDEEPCSSIQSEYSHTTNTRRGTITLIRSGVSTIMVIDAESWNPFYRYPQNLHISLTLDPVYLWYPDTEGQREAGISADGIIGITSTGQCWHDPVGEHSPGCEFWTLDNSLL